MDQKLPSPVKMRKRVILNKIVEKLLKRDRFPFQKLLDPPMIDQPQLAISVENRVEQGSFNTYRSEVDAIGVFRRLNPISCQKNDRP